MGHRLTINGVVIVRNKKVQLQFVSKTDARVPDISGRGFEWKELDVLEFGARRKEKGWWRWG